MQKENQSYSPPEFDGEIKLALSRNESVPALPDVYGVLADLSEETVSCYPSFRELQDAIGDWLGVDSERIVVTNGGDEGIDRVIRGCLKAGRHEIVTHSPSFVMFDIYANNAGGQIQKVDWMGGEFPLREFIDNIDRETALAVVVSPNNPTGLCVSACDVIVLAEHCAEVGCKLLVDLAYIEFADDDPTEALLELPNVVMVRTFSKAWGLAGLRVGYLIAGNRADAHELRASAGPFPVGGVSLELARQSIVAAKDQMLENVSTVKRFRDQVNRLVDKCGGTAGPSQGNFVLAKFADAPQLWLRLAELGVGVRKFANESLGDCMRITVPTDVSSMLHLARAMATATGSEFDLSMIVGEERLSATAKSRAAGESARTSEFSRKTKETDIVIKLDLDGDGTNKISTGIGFLDHMLTALAFHSRMNLELKCEGDLHIDDHHTAEDCALALGAAINEALGPRKDIKRFGYAYAPLDESLARTVLDLSGRPWPEIHLDLKREMVGTIATENLTHFFQSLAMTLKCSLQVDVLRGSNDHHKAEAAFKSLALALKSAISPSGKGVPSTKGVL